MPQPLVLAIEPDLRQAAIVKRIVREKALADIVVVDSRDAAIEAIRTAMPDVLLLSALLSPRDEDELITHLRSLEHAGHLQTHTIPQLASALGPGEDRASRGLLSAFRRKKETAPLASGCDPDLFAEEIRVFLQRAAEKRRDLQTPGHAAPDMRPIAAGNKKTAAEPLEAGAPSSSWSSPFEWKPAGAASVSAHSSSSKPATAETRVPERSAAWASPPSMPEPAAWSSAEADAPEPETPASWMETAPAAEPVPVDRGDAEPLGDAPVSEPYAAEAFTAAEPFAAAPLVADLLVADAVSADPVTESPVVEPVFAQAPADESTFAAPAAIDAVLIEPEPEPLDLRLTEPAESRALPAEPPAEKAFVPVSVLTDSFDSPEMTAEPPDFTLETADAGVSHQIDLDALVERTPEEREPVVAVAARAREQELRTRDRAAREQGVRERMGPLARWARSEAPRAASPAPVTADDVRALISSLAVPHAVAWVSYPRGCRIRRVRVPPAAESDSAEAVGAVILSRRMLAEQRDKRLTV